MKLSAIGEFGLIARIRAQHSAEAQDMIGIGDDCAVIHQGQESSMLLTTDLLIENVHFVLDWIPPRILGRKSMAVNISDIAAMGGQPQWGLISIAIPHDLEVEFFDAFYLGVKEMCQCFRMHILGGDTTSSPSELMISVTVGGVCQRSAILYRSGAKPGDLVFVTGSVGGSAAGLNLYRKRIAPDTLTSYERLIACHNDPQPEVAIGTVAAASRMATAAIDVSDGVLADLTHICEESGVGAQIMLERIPIEPGVREAAALTGGDALEWALTGGEDYRLILTVKPEFREAFPELIRNKCGRQVYEIGEIISNREVLVVDTQGKASQFTRKGWDHFGR